MKAILVIELDYDEQLEELNEAKEIRLYDTNGKYWEWEKFDIKPLPQKLDANDWHRMFDGEYKIREAKGKGYNACIETILGEGNEKSNIGN